MSRIFVSSWVTSVESVVVTQVMDSKVAEESRAARWGEWPTSRFLNILSANVVGA